MYNPDIIEILSGLNLYHITPRNVEANYDDYPFLVDLPKTKRYTFDINSPMFFGFTEFFANYYETGGDLSQKLMFETINPLKLIDFTKGKPMTYDPDILQLGYDGFVARDDVNDYWLEICIFEPNKNIRFIKQIDTKHVDVIGKYPPYIDNITLETYITSRKTNHELIVKKEGYAWKLYKTY